MDKLIQCVPNFSEGRDIAKCEKILNVFRGKENLKLLDYSTDSDHNRMVVTLVGSPAALKAAMLEAVGTAVELINLNRHEGQHPRMGAVDVIPFIPIKNCTIEDADALAKSLAKDVGEKYKLPVFLYEKSASTPARENLAAIRKGQYEGMAEKMQNPEWKPDFGPSSPHPTAGVVAIGARMPLVAFNVNLDTSDLNIADKIARKIRFVGGGLRYVKAIGIDLEDRHITQVSINMTDFTRSTLYQAFEMIKMEARRYGVNVVGSEIIGLVPMQALVDVAEYYLGIEEFSIGQVLETRLMDK